MQVKMRPLSLKQIPSSRKLYVEDSQFENVPDAALIISEQNSHNQINLKM